MIDVEPSTFVKIAISESSSNSSQDEWPLAVEKLSMGIVWAGRTMDRGESGNVINQSPW
jgi:hypothetical protein